MWLRSSRKPSFRKARTATTMKTKTTLIVTVTAIALSLSAGVVQAQYKTVGDDGVAASPKLRERLDEYKRNHTPAPAPARTEAMLCAKCTDFTFAVRDLEPKGLGARTLMAGGPPMKWITSHNCRGCGTKWTITGVGKAKQAVAIHTCTATADASCCKTKPTDATRAKSTQRQESQVGRTVKSSAITTAGDTTLNRAVGWTLSQPTDMP